MDELALFAELRPDDTLTVAELAAMRVELFGDPPQTTLVAERQAELVRLDYRQPVRNRGGGRGVMTVAAVAVAVFGLCGLWWAIERDAGDGSSTSPHPAATEPSATQPSATVPLATSLPDGGLGRPRFGFGEPGWTMSYASETSLGVGRVVVFLSDAGFDGGWVEIRSSPPDAAGSLPVHQLGSLSAQVSEFDDGALVYWSELGGQPLEAYVWQADPDAVVKLLESTSYANDEVVVGVLPAGAALAEPAAANAVGMYGSYRFTHADGRTLDVNINGGGPRGLYSRTGGENRDRVDVDGEQWLLSDYATEGDGEAAGRFRADVLRGFWTWEFDGESFPSRDAFLAAITDVGPVDDAGWETSLPDGFVAGSEQADAVAALLVGVPLPDGFDFTRLADGTTNDRYQFIAHVSGAVACAWLNQWFTANETGDQDMQAEAAAALATSREWPMLVEIADQGGWSDEVWQYADAVNGGEGILTGAGPPTPNREFANSGLGCNL